MTVADRRITIIGGAGFIGHNLALHLKALGADVSIIDGLEVNNLTSVLGNTDNLPHPQLSYGVITERLRLLQDARIPLLVQDARDYHALSHLLTRTNPQVIIHLAAVSHANRSNKDPYSTFDHSLRTLENALDFAKTQVEHFVFLSSSMVYGHFKDGAVDESTACEPLGIYGALKFSGEKMVIAYHQVFGLEYTILRPSALYGERCISRRVGQIFIENALFGQEIVVNGDGSDGLDFTYIQDLVDGLTRVIEEKGARNQIFNLTYGSARTIGDMLDILRQHFPD
ncbi:MAG TPA: NAD(P)-dependent oxidoreductase, partial [Vicinamibacterales bacterium]|nr:NAD(P)-dependent oxidoreductase [Vicinamibacterales bacterium]